MLHPETIGIDISKRHLDVSDGRTFMVANDAEALAPFLADWAARQVLVVFEATGHYDLVLRTQLERFGVRFVRLNPQQARDYARATGRRAKTDRIDAQMLADMGRRLDLTPGEPSDPARGQLAFAHRRRDQLVAMRQQERTRLGESPPAGMGDAIQRHLAFLDEEIALLEAMIEEIIAQAGLRREAELIRSVPGIGPVAAATLLALMPELGQVSPKQIAALGGLAPYANDSGQFRGKRSVRGGRTRVRRALYMAAMAASHGKTRLAQAYRALVEKGKPPKLALIAIARRILTIANAVLRDKTPCKIA